MPGPFPGVGEDAEQLLATVALVAASFLVLPHRRHCFGPDPAHVPTTVAGNPGWVCLEQGMCDCAPMGVFCARGRPRICYAANPLARSRGQEMLATPAPSCVQRECVVVEGVDVQLTEVNQLGITAHS